MKTYPMWKGNLWNDYKEDYVGATFNVVSTMSGDFVGILEDNEDSVIGICNERPDQQFARTKTDNLGEAMNLAASIMRSREMELTWVATKEGESLEETINEMYGNDMIAFERDSKLYSKGFTVAGVIDAYRSASEVAHVSKFN